MSDRWYYRVFGQEFGPVSLDLVRTLVASGTIASDDEVRDARRSNWILACAASELRDSIKTTVSDLTIERREVRDEWFCRGASGDFGPLALSELIRLAAVGELKPDEVVKTTANDYWKQICSIARLVELLPFADRLNPGNTNDLGVGPRLLRPFDETNDPIESNPAGQGGTSESSKIAQTIREQNKFVEHSNPIESSKVENVTDHERMSANLERREICSTDVAPDRFAPDHTNGFEYEILLFPGVRSEEVCDSKCSETDLPVNGDCHCDTFMTPNLTSEPSNVFASVNHSQSLPTASFASTTMSSPHDETQSMNALDRLETAMNASDIKWTGWIAGEEFGPVDYSELLSWAVTGRLSPMDFVRRGDEGQYLPAVNVPCLFTVRAAANSLSRPVRPVAVDLPERLSSEN